MTIAIVSSFVKPPALAKAADSDASTGTLAADGSTNPDFASLLLGLPAGTAPASPRDEASPDREKGKKDRAEAGPAVTDGAFLTAYGLTSPPQPGLSEAALKAVIGPTDPLRKDLASPTAAPTAAPMAAPTASPTASPMAAPTAADGAFLAALGLTPPPQPGRSEPAEPREKAETKLADPLRSDSLPAPLSITTATRSLGVTRPAIDDTPSSASAASAAVVAVDQPAKLAAVAFAAAISERVEPASAAQILPAVAETSDLATVAAPPPPFLHGAADSHEIPTHLRDPSWVSDFGHKLLWFAGNDKQVAQLTLNPPYLGSIEVTLDMSKGSANAHFASANAEVRGTIETAVPRLREMFASAGIELGQVSVGSESFRQQSNGQPQPSYPPRQLADKAILGIDSAGGFLAETAAARRGSAMIDIFA